MALECPYSHFSKNAAGERFVKGKNTFFEHDPKATDLGTQWLLWLLSGATAPHAHFLMVRVVGS